MSQTETLMLVALGFSAALFLVLLFGRGIWAVLGRWSGWREARQVPRTIRDLQAERDSLKAEKAMMASKLDSSMSDMKLRLAEQMAEVSRNRNRLLDANGKLQSQSDEISKLKSEVAKRDDKIASLNAQIEENVKAIAQAWAKTADHESDTNLAHSKHKEALSAINIREDRIRNLESESKALREIIAAFLPGKDITAEMQAVAEHKISPAYPSSNSMSDKPSNVTHLPETGMNAFQARFNVNGAGNPLLPIQIPDALTLPQHENDQPLLFPRETEQTNSLEKGVSNVLSLAERVRGLQKNVNK